MVLRQKDEQPDRELEEELRAKLGRIPAPLGLKSRILAEARARELRKKKPLWFSIPFARAVALVLIVVLGAAVVLEREHQRRVEGERAKEQVMLALRITGTALQTVHNRVSEER